MTLLCQEYRKSVEIKVVGVNIRRNLIGQPDTLYW